MWSTCTYHILVLYKACRALHLCAVVWCYWLDTVYQLCYVASQHDTSVCHVATTGGGCGVDLRSQLWQWQPVWCPLPAPDQCRGVPVVSSVAQCKQTLLPWPQSSFNPRALCIRPDSLPPAACSQPNVAVFRCTALACVQVVSTGVNVEDWAEVLPSELLTTKCGRV